MSDTKSLPVVANYGGRAITTSRDVAAFFGKRHVDIFRAIKKLTSEIGVGIQHHYAKSLWISPDRRAFWQYDVDRDGFMLLAAGLKGPNALMLKASYLTAFNQVEDAMKSTAPMTRLYMQPSTVKRLCGADGGISLDQTAHTFNVKESRFMKVLRYGGWVYRRDGKLSAYRPKIDAGLLKNDYSNFHCDDDGQDRYEVQVLATPKGLEHLAEFFDLKTAA